MKEENITDTSILKKCGWSDYQLNFYGTLIHNIVKSNGEPIADIISNRSNEQISIEWFVPNKEGNKISAVYSLVDQKLIQDKTDSEIKDEKSFISFLDNIQNTINGFQGVFFPKSKIFHKDTKITLK